MVVVRYHSMVRLLETSRSNCCGETLFSVKYLPERPPNAVLCFHHGLGEHIGRYDGRTFLVD